VKQSGQTDCASPNKMVDSVRDSGHRCFATFVSGEGTLVFKIASTANITFVVSSDLTLSLEYIFWFIVVFFFITEDFWVSLLYCPLLSIHSLNPALQRFGRIYSNDTFLVRFWTKPGLFTMDTFWRNIVLYNKLLYWKIRDLLRRLTQIRYSNF